MYALVEGDLDEAVARRILAETGHEFGTCYGKKGCDYIREKLVGFNNMARSVPCLTLIDYVDASRSHLGDDPCPPDVARGLLRHPEPNMLVRLVVREVESWLLADRAGLASFLAVSVGSIPSRPEEVDDPKRSLINAARRSRSSRIRNSLVPREGTTSQIGHLYSSEMRRFVRDCWDVQKARHAAESLDRCLGRLCALSGNA